MFLCSIPFIIITSTDIKHKQYNGGEEQQQVL